MTKLELFKLISLKPNGNIQEPIFKKRFSNFYKDISSWIFPGNFKWSQKVWHYLKDDKQLSLGLCPICGKRCKFGKFNSNYSKHCSTSCSTKDEQTQIKKRETCQKLYNADSYSQTDEYKIKTTTTCQKRYHKDYYSQTDEYKERVRKKCLELYNVDNYSKTKECKEKREQTCLERFGVRHALQCEEIKERLKQTNLERHGVEYIVLSEDFQDKLNQTKKKNHTFNTSKIEEDLYKWFIENNINVIRQYKSELYPFTCDFYLPDYDLYVEINGIWTHGEHPFNENNKEDINKLNKWIEKSKTSKYYKKAIEVWTKRDVLKRNIAKENKLNYLEIFSTNLQNITEIIFCYIYNI